MLEKEIEAWLEQLRADYHETRRQNQEYDEILERLEQAKRIVTFQKEEFGRRVDAEAEFGDSTAEWKGNTFDTFQKQLETLTQENRDYLKHDLDQFLDEICDEITKFENKRNNNFIILGDLQSGINNLLNEIEKGFN